MEAVGFNGTVAFKKCDVANLRPFKSPIHIAQSFDLNGVLRQQNTSFRLPKKFMYCIALIGWKCQKFYADKSAFERHLIGRRQTKVAHA
jgi:hypothetical protein